jgi:hypothetical protein
MPIAISLAVRFASGGRATAGTTRLYIPYSDDPRAAAAGQCREKVEP